jgi:hypothetical protein
MIPLSCSDFVEYKDDDGTVFKFKPKTGRLERRLCELFSSIEGKPALEQINLRDAFINDILVGWSGAGLPAFPIDGTVADMFGAVQKNRIFEMWNCAGDATVEEKKT